MALKAKDSFGKKQWSKEQAAFFDEFRRETEINELISDRIWNDKVRISIRFTEGNNIRLQEIEAFTIGQGDGGRALNWFIELTQKHDLTLNLNIQPFGDNKTHYLYDPKKLHEWYRKRGCRDKTPNLRTSTLVHTPQKP